MHRYVFLTVILMYNQDVVLSHILTSTKEMPVSTCMKMLAFSVKELCLMYGDYSDDIISKAPAGFARDLENRIKEWRIHVLKQCCMKPCTLPQLLSIC